MSTTQSLSIVQQFQGIQLIVEPNKDHSFLMSTENVAKGYGVSSQAILAHRRRNEKEFIENLHYISHITICNVKSKATFKQYEWTKRGVIRLGMFIKSQRAIKFRDWAENLIIDELDGKKGDKPKERSLGEIISLAKDILTAMNKNPQTNRFLFYTCNGMTQILPVEEGACVVNPSNVINITTFIREFASAETIPAIIESGVARLRRAADWAESKVKQA